MEIDFLGLFVKQEISEDTTDAAPLRSSPMQWPFSKKGSSLLSFHSVQEENPKTGFGSLASTRSEAFDSAQKNIYSENQGGVHHTMTTYPTKQHLLDTYAFHHPVTNETNLTISPPTTNSIHHSVIATSRQNLIGSASSHTLAVDPMINPVPAMPSNTPFVGTTDLRNASNIPGALAQLTIFYNGSVCVYDNVAPEKAQAMMLLAGNGPPMTSNATPPPARVQASVPRPNVLDGFVMSQSYSPNPHRLSPVPVNSISVSHSVGRSNANNDTNITKPAGVILSSSYNATPPPAPVQASVPRPNVLDGFVMSQSYSPNPHRLSPTLVNSISVSHSIGRSNANNDTNIAKPAGVILSSSYNATPPPARVQASVPRPNVLDGFVMGQSYSPNPHRSSPAPVNSISVSHSVGRSNANNDTNIAKPAGVTLSSSYNADPPRVVNSVASVATTAGAVPQFRHKSLARFLEKRKERVISANPYADKKSLDLNNPGDGVAKSSVNS